MNKKNSMNRSKVWKKRGQGKNDHAHRHNVTSYIKTILHTTIRKHKYTLRERETGMIQILLDILD